MSSEVERLRELNDKSYLEVEHNLEEEGEKMIAGEAEDNGHVHGENCSHSHKKQRGGNKKPRKNYGVIGYTIFTCLSCLYLQTQYFYPMHPDLFKRNILPGLSYLIVFFALWSYIQTIRTNNHIKKVKGIPNLIDEQSIDSNYLSKQCDSCKYYKMPRVSHCSTCGMCILKLDHHCVWTQNCIGYRNQRPFYYFAVWMSLGLLQFWTATYTTYFQITGNCSFFSHFEPGVYILWTITCFSASFVGLMIVALFISHTMMILTNNTTLMQIKSKKVCPCPFCELRSVIISDDNINQFDRGQIQNIRNLFGSTNILLSLMPLTREVTHDFLCEQPNPLPTPLQLSNHLGQLQSDLLRYREMREQAPKIKTIFKGKKMQIKGKVIEL